MAQKSNRIIVRKPFPFIDFPNWVVWLYGSASVLLLPWIFYLADELPNRYVSHHWDLAWAGFDILMFILLVMTTIATARQSSAAVLFASALGTLLLIDAWFDTITSRHGHQQIQAILVAVLVEIPLALLSFLIAHWVMVYIHRIEPHPNAESE
ncbi:MAG TPA: hypothetical protein VGS28_02580 [Candidatus Saccharimonadales bacterium]|nr:hypothetical protein [Candidatus Saccharimonadales bacterium]